MAILNRHNSLDGQFCTDRPSTHPSFGKRQGYLCGFYIDKKANTQWNYLYEDIIMSPYAVDLQMRLAYEGQNLRVYKIN